ncbi:MAG: SGNH/GDSL hydrolase family protein [Clostridia bacterium]|nr:SGNH/GDSL hydrolase family protein [Clostridia bacterium]
MNDRPVKVSPDDYAPAFSSRQRENIEWSTTYAYNATDDTLPRVLLIGDSICNAYQGRVRELLDGRMNVSFWASSKCVTDPDYFRELDFILDERPYGSITFNNGLHSLNSDRTEWTAAYRAAVAFIRAKLPRAELFLMLSTPLKDEKLTVVSAELNETVKKIAEERSLPIIDLFSPMDGLDRERYWSDTFHFSPEAVGIQAELIALCLTGEDGSGAV